MRAILRDVRHGVRSLYKNPGVASVVILTLALGIGANTTIFSVVNGVLLKPLPFEEPGRLVGLRERLPDEGTIPASYRTYAELRDRNTVFQNIAAMFSWSPNLESGEEPVRVEGMAVSASYFDVMGVKPLLGRGFLAEEDRPGADRVVVLSHELWSRNFGGDPDIVGKTLKVSGRPVRVVGVMPPALADPEVGWASIWTPLMADDVKARSNPGRYLKMNARLKPGVSVEQASAEAERIMSLLRHDFPETHGKEYGADVRPLEDFVVPKGTRTALRIMLGVVGCVLLIACANIANVLLARAAAREKEIAIRSALGASRRRVMRQLLVESWLLSLLGAGAGLLLAGLGLKLLLLFGPDAIPRAEDIRLNLPVLGFTLGLAALAGLVFGVAPALAATRLDPATTLKEGGRGGSGGSRNNRLRGLLVVSQVAAALLLLIVSGLMLKSYMRLSDVRLGFEPDNVLTTEINLPALRYPEPEQRVAFFRDLVGRVAALPGITAVGAAQSLPIRGPIYTDPVFVEGQPAPRPGQEPYIRQNIVTSDFFRALGVPLVKGRAFNDREVWESGGVVVVNESFARRFFPGEEPLGKRIKLGEDMPWMEVVGLVGDAVQDGPEGPTIPEMFYPYTNPSADVPLSFMTLVLRTSVEPASLAGGVRNVVRELDPALPVSKVLTMRAITDRSVSKPRFNALMLGLFAGLSLLLATVGIYGVTAYLVSKRSHEIAIRMALGARGGDILWLIVGRGMALTLLGILLGIAGALALTRVIGSLLYGVSSMDPLVFVGVPSLLALVALAACYIPARRALKVEPAAALRGE